MGKESGMGDRLFCGGYDISGDTGSVSTIRAGVDLLECTAIDKSAKERFRGLADGDIEFSTYFNPSSGASHEILSTLPTADTGVMYLHGAAYGNAGAGMVAKQVDYAPARKEDGAFTFKTAAKANGFGLDWGEQLTPGKVTLGVGLPGTAIDYGASVGTTNFGLQAYLQVFAGFAGTSATVAIQGSSDNAVGDPFADITGAVFAPASATGTQRIQTTRTQAVERYLRVNITGTFSNFVFCVVVCRNAVSWNP
jgi:hypothetical protein